MTDKPTTVRISSAIALEQSQKFAELVRNFAIENNVEDDTIIGLCADIIFRIYVVTSSPTYTDAMLCEYLRDTLGHYRRHWDIEQSKHATKQ